MDTPIIDQKEYTVYLVTNQINGKKYVGITIQGLDLRLRGHFSKAKVTKDNRKFYNAIRKYGEENFRIERLDSASSYDELKEKEKRYIAELDTYNTGYNSTLGGDGTIGAITSIEVREKHRKNKIDHFATKENRDKYSRMNAVLSDEQVLEICRLAKSGELNCYQIADRFGIGQATVSEILNFKTYRHVDRDFVGARSVEAARMKLVMSEIFTLYNDGLGYDEIGARVGLDGNTIIRKLRTALGHSPISPDMRRHEERNNKIADEHRNGKSNREIAAMFGISIDTVRKKLKKAGLHGRSNNESTSV